MNFYYMQTFFSLGLGDIGELKINVLLHQNSYSFDEVYGNVKMLEWILNPLLKQNPRVYKC